MRFAVYSDDHKVAMRGVEFEAMQALFRDGYLLARAEDSGNEGYYVEVARYDSKRREWLRFAHLKVFGGEDAVAKGWDGEGQGPLGPATRDARETAERIADSLNSCSDGPRSIVHKLRNWGSEPPLARVAAGAASVLESLAGGLPDKLDSVAVGAAARKLREALRSYSEGGG